MRSIQSFFKNKFGLSFEDSPSLERDVKKSVNLDVEMKASGF